MRKKKRKIEVEKDTILVKVTPRPSTNKLDARSKHNSYDLTRGSKFLREYSPNHSLHKEYDEVISSTPYSCN